MPLSPHQWERVCEVTISEVPLPSGPPVSLSPAEVPQTHRGQRGNEGLVRDLSYSFLNKHWRVVRFINEVNTEVMFNSAQNMYTVWKS